MYQTFKFKKDRIAYLREMLAIDKAWAIRGLLAIYAFQTAEEQQSGDVVEQNGVGFTGADGDILSSFAARAKSGRDLSEKQMEILFRKMPKYARQLDGVAQAKLSAEA